MKNSKSGGDERSHHSRAESPVTNLPGASSQLPSIVQKCDWTIATILTIHGFCMIVAVVAIAAVFMVECIKADGGYSVFTSVVTDSISPNYESVRSPFKCYLFVLYEN